MVYLITFRCYGTWLHGDARGSVDRVHNQYGEPLAEPNAGLERNRDWGMSSPKAHLTEEMRACVALTVSEVAAHRGWAIHALNVRTNHVHVVVGAEEKPEKIMNDFKAWSTRNLRNNGLLSAESSLWTAHGSTRYLHGSRDFVEACRYVVAEQGEDLGEGSVFYSPD